VLVLALAFGLIRPLLRNLVAGSGGASGQYLAGGKNALVPVGAASPGSAGAIGAPSYDDKVSAARNITGHDPARVAQVVRKWVSSDD
jgi:flagellar biosynthesis/type III secretory pathway M-ring protein FliF/YscJ